MTSQPEQLPENTLIAQLQLLGYQVSIEDNTTPG